MPSRSLLSHHRLPACRFDAAGLPEPVAAIWQALADGNDAQAAALCRRHTSEGADALQRAALLVAQAEISLRRAHHDLAERSARQALAFWPTQWMGHRLLLAALEGQQHYLEALGHLQGLDAAALADGPAWDDALAPLDQQHATAAWSWHLGDWDAVHGTLLAAYPNGIASMPETLQEDWLRLALYRDAADDAAAVAALMIQHRSIEGSDKMLQTLVRQGWTEQALGLYRTLYAAAPDQDFLRRRLVALCIREGVLDEARQLSRLGALRAA